MPGTRNSKCSSAEGEMHAACSYRSRSPVTLVKPAWLGLTHGAQGRCLVCDLFLLQPVRGSGSRSSSRRRT